MPARAPMPPKRVLIIKPSALGDVVSAVPVLRGLRRTFPSCHIAWLVRSDCAPLIRHDANLDEVIIFERKKLGKAWKSLIAAAALKELLVKLARGRFDWVLDLQGLIRSGIFAGFTLAPVRAGFARAREGAATFYTHRIRTKARHTIDANIELARAMGIDARPEDLKLAVEPAAKTSAGQLAEKLAGGRKFLICAPTTVWRTKMYPARHWRKVLAELSGRLPVLVIGSPSDRDMRFCREVAEGLGPDVHNICGRTDVAEMVALVASSAGVLCCDSAAKFIAPAVGVDCLCLVGPTRTEHTGPYLRGTAIIADVPCQGCLKKSCPHITCMELIQPQTVVAQALQMIEKVSM
ncbi:MAG: glycosyltransferase family 9 protein [Planctomycetes bacterium]|nr:glycosyltransferase family 9 protein [Planctomycetota bacterium]